MSREVGHRVGAIFGSDATEQTLDFLGYGVYEGDFLPVEAGGTLAQMGREAGITNPRLRLDNGDVVYGCECWWGSEDQVARSIADAKKKGWAIRIIPIADARKAAERGPEEAAKP